ncbi:hypothetical protein TNCV_4271831 [Trichonephila clavipes]|nr:hypothetical protein TNCV_4271831 [Trichonephila clavipes]
MPQRQCLHNDGEKLGDCSMQISNRNSKMVQRGFQIIEPVHTDQNYTQKTSRAGSNSFAAPDKNRKCRSFSKEKN